MSRRLVVVLFLDLVGWTRLSERVDPEPLQQLLEGYYEICSSAVEEHGGVVEKFIGDAIMAVFGAVRSQEDDALRALRAAMQIRTEVSGLRSPASDAPPVEVHAGVAAGEALVTYSVRAGIRVVGDVVNLAARLQGAAAAGEIVVNETVAQLARPHFAMLPTPPLTLKGKAKPVPTLLVTGQAAGDPNGDGSPLVDRSGERRRLREAFHRVVRDRRPEVVTVQGPPGIGKTRLARAALAEIIAVETETVTVFGSCPSYGMNGNYAVLVEVLDSLIRQSAPSAERMRSDARIAAVLEELRYSSHPRRSVGAPGPAVEEVAWAARELFAAATSQPFVVVWDGLEGAGTSLLRLIGELPAALKDRPLLMVCLARLELASRGVPWMSGGEGCEVIDVGGLAPSDSARLAALLGDEVQSHDTGRLEHAAAYSGGNPLFIRLLVEWLAASHGSEDVPPTITAMIGAMIDRLPADAQRLVGAASVIGPAFTVAQLALLGEDVAQQTLDVLTEQHLLHPTGTDGGYRFVQQPVHEVAYRRLEKEQRVTWHRRLAERDFTPAFHFESAMRLLSELRPNDTDLPLLSRRAAEALLLEGTASLRQRDVPAAISLLERALALADGGTDSWRAVTGIRLSDALMLSGQTRQALDVVQRLDQSPCLVQRQLLAARLGRVPDGDVEELAARLGEEEADELALCRLEQLRMLIQLGRGRFAAAEQAALAALGHARAIGDAYEEDRLLVALCEVRQWSPTPVAEKLAGCTVLLERFASDRFLLVPALTTRARCLALTGDAAGARAALAEAESVVEQLGVTMGRVLVEQVAGLACSLDGDHQEAARHYGEAAAALEAAGYLPTALTMRVQAVRERACQDTDSAAGAAEETAALLERHDEMDLRGRVLCMATQARLAAEAGRRDSVLGAVPSMLDDTDDPVLRAEVYFDLARAHRHLGDVAEARVMADAAVDSYAAVGATRPLGTVRAWM